MTRPRKQTVDYFPHVVRHGKTMHILEQRWGNDGYAFWFKTLELMGDTEGHYLDCNLPTIWNYLLSITRQTEECANEILNMLSDLEAIDQALWKENRVVWSDNFIKGVAIVYRNRRVETPERPDNYTKKLKSKSQSTSKKPHRIEENRIEENRRKSSASPDNGDALPTATPVPFYTCKHFELDNDFITKLLQEYPALNQETITSEISKAHDWLDDNPDRHKRRANGHLKNPRTFLKNWLNRATINPKGQQKGFQGKGIMAWASRQEDL